MGDVEGKSSLICCGLIWSLQCGWAVLQMQLINDVFLAPSAFVVEGSYAAPESGNSCTSVLDPFLSVVGTRGLLIKAVIITIVCSTKKLISQISS